MLARMNQVYHHVLQVMLEGFIDHPRREPSGQVSKSTNQQQQPIAMMMSSARLMLMLQDGLCLVSCHAWTRCHTFNCHAHLLLV